MSRRPLVGPLLAGSLLLVLSLLVPLANARASSVPPGGWQGPEQLSPAGVGVPTGLACPSVRQCFAVDTAGNVASYRRSGWGMPREKDHGWGRLLDVSCTSAGFCAAVGDGVTVVRMDGTWRLEEHWPRSFDRVSCGSASRCLATGAGESLLWNGSHWRPLRAPTGSRGTVRGACSGRTCMVVDAAGHTFRLTGRHWHRAGVLRSPGRHIADFARASVSCPRPRTCVVATHVRSHRPDVVFRWDGTRWRGVSLRMPHSEFPNHLVTLSCAAARVCLFIDNNGWSRQYDGRWHRPTRVYSDYDANQRWLLSCPSTRRCVLVAGPGQTRVYDGSWHRVPAYPPVQRTQLKVSCTSSTFCMALELDGVGRGIRYDGSSWATVKVSASYAHAPVAALSCTSPTFCLALDRHRQVLGWDGTRWSTPAPLPAGRWDRLACTGLDFCIVLASYTEGNPVLLWDGTGWQPGPPAPFTTSTLSCPTATVCLAGASGPFAIATFSDGEWGAPTAIDPTRRLNTVGTLACSAERCLAQAESSHGARHPTYVSDGSGWHPTSAKPYFTAGACFGTTCFARAKSPHGRFFTLSGDTWSKQAGIGPEGYVATTTSDISCAAAGTCAVVDGNGNAFVRR